MQVIYTLTENELEQIHMLLKHMDKELESLVNNSGGMSNSQMSKLYTVGRDLYSLQTIFKEDNNEVK